MSWETRTFSVPRTVSESRDTKCPTCGHTSQYEDEIPGNPKKQRIFDWIEEHHPYVVARTAGWSGGGMWVPKGTTPPPSVDVTVRVRRVNKKGTAA